MVQMDQGPFGDGYRFSLADHREAEALVLQGNEAVPRGVLLNHLFLPRDDSLAGGAALREGDPLPVFLCTYQSIMSAHVFLQTIRARFLVHTTDTSTNEEKIVFERISMRLRRRALAVLHHWLASGFWELLLEDLVGMLDNFVAEIQTVDNSAYLVEYLLLVDVIRRNVRARTAALSSAAAHTAPCAAAGQPRLDDAPDRERRCQGAHRRRCAGDRIAAVDAAIARSRGGADPHGRVGVASSAAVGHCRPAFQ